MDTLSVDTGASTTYREVEQICNRVRDVFDRPPYQWQIEAWEAIFGKQQDVIVIARTGGGKSRIFQSLHFARAGAITLVISPLLGLIIEQVLHLILNQFLSFR